MTDITKQVTDIVSEKIEEIKVATKQAKVENEAKVDAKVEEINKTLEEQNAKLNAEVEELKKEQSTIATEVKCYKDMIGNSSETKSFNNAQYNQAESEVHKEFLNIVTEKKGNGDGYFFEANANLPKARLGLVPSTSDFIEQKNSNLVRSDVYNRLGFNNHDPKWDGIVRETPYKISLLRRLASVETIQPGQQMRVVYEDEEISVNQRKEAEIMQETSLTVKSQLISPFSISARVRTTRETIESSMTNIERHVLGRANKAFALEEDRRFINHKDAGGTSVGLRYQVRDANRPLTEIGLETQGQIVRDDLYSALAEIPYGYNPTIMLGRKAFFALKKEKSLEHYQNTFQSLDGSLSISGRDVFGLFEGIPVIEHPYLDDLTVLNTQGDPNSTDGLVGLVADMSYFQIGVEARGVEYFRNIYNESNARIVSHEFNEQMAFGVVDPKAFVPIMNYTK